MRWTSALSQFGLFASEATKTALAGGKTEAQLGNIRTQLKTQKFAPGLFSAAVYDAKKFNTRRKYDHMSWNGEIWIRGNDEVALLKMPPRIGVIRDGKFVDEVPLEKYVEGRPDAAKIVEVIGPFACRPVKISAAVIGPPAVL